jgi:hypothetical protein
MKRDRAVCQGPSEADDETAGRASGIQRVVRLPAERPTARPPSKTAPPRATGSSVVSGSTSDRPTRRVRAPLGPENIEETLEPLERFLRDQTTSIVPHIRVPPAQRAVQVTHFEPAATGGQQGRRAGKAPIASPMREHAVDGRTTKAPKNSALFDAARVSSLVPFVRGSRADLLRARMNGLSGFVLSLVDGVSSIEAILGVAHMPSHQALRVIHSLWSDGIIGLR